MPLFEDAPAPRRQGGWLAPTLIASGLALVAASAAVVAMLAGMAGSASPQPSPAADGEAGAAAQYSDDGFAVVDWDWWESVNPDVVGWVNVPGTSISQPICQAPADDPDYYNTHDAYGSYNLLGCPFLHADNAGTGGLLSSRNAVVQGHNVAGSPATVFAEFADFADEGYAAEHKAVLLQTREAKVELEAFCVEVIPYAGSDSTLSTSFESQEQFDAYVSERLESSAVTLSGAPRLAMWTFSTCSYFLTPANERTVVHCKAAGTAGTR